MSYDLSIAQLRGTAAQLRATNATPVANRLCIETDTGKAKIGDGSTAFNSLSYTTLTGEERKLADVAYDGQVYHDANDEVGEGGAEPPFEISDITGLQDAIND
jgi:hypothetical protein